MLAHLGALGRHVGPLGRHLVPLARHLIANMSENVPKSPKTAPKMPQTPLPSLPKVPKTKENMGGHGMPRGAQKLLCGRCEFPIKSSVCIAFLCVISRRPTFLYIQFRQANRKATRNTLLMQNAMFLKKGHRDSGTGGHGKTPGS